MGIFGHPTLLNGHQKVKSSSSGALTNCAWLPLRIGHFWCADSARQPSPASASKLNSLTSKENKETENCDRRQNHNTPILWAVRDKCHAVGQALSCSAGVGEVCSVSGVRLPISSPDLPTFKLSCGDA